jgi:uncharacterized protein (TIGR03792 family)
MVIEWLKFRVSEQSRAKFLDLDAKIWTSALVKYHGFMNKEVLFNPQKNDEVVLVIRWQSRQDWSAVPADILQQTETAFAAAMGDDRYQMLEALEYRLYSAS